MLALSGSIKYKVDSIIKANFDIVLHCSGNIIDAEQVLIHTPLLNNNLSNQWKVHLGTIENSFKTINKEIYKEKINKIFYDVLKINSDYY